MINRRKFIVSTALSTAGALVTGAVATAGHAKKPTLATEEEAAAKAFDLMAEVKKYRKLDAHVHLNLGTDDMNAQKKHAEVLYDYCNRLSVDYVFLSNPVTHLINHIPDGSVEAFIKHNDNVMNVVKIHPDKFKGVFTFNPAHQKESLEEIKRCVDHGMVAAKVYYQTKINDPLFYPLIEKLIDLKMVMLMHAEAQLGVGGYRMKYNGNKPTNVSIPEDFVDIAKRYPEMMFQFAHIGGGGDWEYMCKMLADSPNVFVDCSGSNNAEHMLDFAVKTLGEDRIFFGSDNCYYQSVGKILASNLTEAQKHKIFFGNFNNALRKSGNNVS